MATEGPPPTQYNPGHVGQELVVEWTKYGDLLNHIITSCDDIITHLTDATGTSATEPPNDETRKSL